MSGVRASSIRIESTSSTIANGVAALDHVLGPHRHVVAQVVEPELVVGAVGEVGGVRGTAVGGVICGLDQPDRDAERPVDRPHPLGVPLGQVVVHGHDVDAAARERVQVGRHRRGEGLALTGLHLGDLALVQRDRPHDLHVEVALADRAPGRLAHARERLRQEVVERLAVGEPPAELRRLGGELLVREVLDLGLERVHQADEALELLSLAALADLTEFLDDHGGSFVQAAGLHGTGSPRLRPERGDQRSLATAGRRLAGRRTATITTSDQRGERHPEHPEARALEHEPAGEPRRSPTSGSPAGR